MNNQIKKILLSLILALACIDIYSQTIEKCYANLADVISDAKPLSENAKSFLKSSMTLMDDKNFNEVVNLETLGTSISLITAHTLGIHTELTLKKYSKSNLHAEEKNLINELLLNHINTFRANLSTINNNYERSIPYINNPSIRDDAKQIQRKIASLIEKYSVCDRIGK